MSIFFWIQNTKGLQRNLRLYKFYRNFRGKCTGLSKKKFILNTLNNCVVLLYILKDAWDDAGMEFRGRYINYTKQSVKKINNFILQINLISPLPFHNQDLAFNFLSLA